MGNSWTSIGYNPGVYNRKTLTYDDYPGKNTTVMFCPPGLRGNFILAESGIVDSLWSLETRYVPFSPISGCLISMHTLCIARGEGRFGAPSTYLVTRGVRSLRKRQGGKASDTKKKNATNWHLNRCSKTTTFTWATPAREGGKTSCEKSRAPPKGGTRP